METWQYYAIIGNIYVAAAVLCGENKKYNWRLLTVFAVIYLVITAIEKIT